MTAILLCGVAYGILCGSYYVAGNDVAIAVVTAYAVIN